MSLRDRDLISIQEARQALERASEAQKKFAVFSQEEIDAVVEACAQAATEAGEPLARLAVEETGYGNVPDKILKNRLASVEVPRAIRGMKTAGILREDREKGVLEIGEPFGVVAAVIPCTNPTSTAIYKTLIALKARNAIVLSPHPSAIRCICQTASVLKQAALQIGAPEGLIECLNHSTMQGTQELMRSRLTGVILATGGTGLVRAAYSSGRPAYGVGPGNVPAMIERTANVRKAVADIIAGKTFDYGTICSSEQAIVAEEAIAEEALAECVRQGGYFLTADEIARLGPLVFPGGAATPNPKIVGRAATVIAEMAGIRVPAGTRVLIARLDAVGREAPLSGEKLSPILAFYSAPNFAAGVDLCVRLLQHGGMGHTAAIHSQSEAAVKQYGLAVPAFRVVVNSASVHGSIGYSTNLFPAMTLGCGAPGGNITSDNIGPQHLMNIKRVAWESRAVEHRTIPAEQRLVASNAGEAAAFAPRGRGERRKAEITFVLADSAAQKPGGQGIDDAVTGALPGSVASVPASEVTANLEASDVDAIPDRATIARIVEHAFIERGIPRGGAAPAALAMAAAAAGTSTASDPAPAPTRANLPPSSSIAAEVVAAHFPVASTPAKPERAAASAAEAPGDAAASSSTNTKDAPAAINVAEFICENDARGAATRGQKIYVGPKTIVTPAAREFGDQHDIFVMTDVVPPPAKKSRSQG